MRLPAKAMRVAGPNDPIEGPSAMTTPAKPTMTALHRHQPTFSPRKSAAMTVT